MCVPPLGPVVLSRFPFLFPHHPVLLDCGPLGARQIRNCPADAERAAVCNIHMIREDLPPGGGRQKYGGNFPRQNNRCFCKPLDSFRRKCSFVAYTSYPQWRATAKCSRNVTGRQAAVSLDLNCPLEGGMERPRQGIPKSRLLEFLDACDGDMEISGQVRD